jgi:hypothetical protein
MIKCTDLKQLPGLIDGNKYVSLNHNGMRIVGFNQPKIDIKTHLKRITDKINKDHSEPGEYIIEAKNYPAGIVESIQYIKPGKVDENIDKLPLSEKQEFAFDIYKKDFEITSLKRDIEILNKDIDTLTKENTTLQEDLDKVENEIEALEKQIKDGANNKEESFLSEKSAKSIEGILLLAAPILTPLAESFKQNRQDNSEMKKRLFEFTLQDKFKHLRKNGHPAEETDEFIIFLKQLKIDNPEYYNDLVDYVYDILAADQQQDTDEQQQQQEQEQEQEQEQQNNNDENLNPE